MTMAKIRAVLGVLGFILSALFYAPQLLYHTWKNPNS